jgi:hypothetical protein
MWPIGFRAGAATKGGLFHEVLALLGSVEWMMMTTTSSFATLVPTYGASISRYYTWYDMR